MRRVENASQKKSQPSVDRSLCRRKQLLAVAVGTGSMLMLNPAARATYYYWDVGTPSTAPTVATSGTWQAGSWTTSGQGGAPVAGVNPGISDIAIFNVPGVNVAASTVEAISLAAPQSALGLIFDNNSTSSTVQVQSSGTPTTLTLGSSGVVLSAGANNGNATAVTLGSATVSNALTVDLSGSQVWNNNTGSVFTVLNSVTNASATAPATLTISSYNSTATTSGATILGVISDNTSAGQVSLTAALGNVGSVILGGANTYTGNTTAQSGILSLDFSQTGAPTSNIVSSSSNLVVGGGTTFTLAGAVIAPTLLLKGSSASGGVDSQTFASTAVKAGNTTFTLTANGATTLTENLGAITRSGAGTINFSVVPAATGVIATTTTANDASGMLADWATTGTTSSTYAYLTVNGSNQIVPYTGATAATSGLANLTVATTNYNTASGFTTAASSTLTANTLRLISGGSTCTLGTGSTLTLNGLMMAGSGGDTFTGGSMVIGANKELVVTGDNIVLTLNSPIVNSLAGTSGVTYATQLAVNVGGANKYTGTTTLNSTGVTATVADVAGVSGAFGVGGPITFSGGVLQYSAASVGSDYSARFKNSTAPIAIDLESASRVGTVWNGVIDSSNTGGLTVKNTGSVQSTLTINGSNSFSGNTVIDSPIDLVLGNGSALGTSSLTTNISVAISASTDLTGANALPNNFFNDSTLQFEGLHSMQVNGIVGFSPLGNSNKALVNNIGVGALTLAGRVNESGVVNGVNNFYFTGIGNTNITGVIANDASGTGASSTLLDYNTGVTTLSNTNTYTGGTTVYEGTIKLDFSATGAPVSNILSTASKLTLNGGNLTLVGGTGANANDVQNETQGLTFGSGSSQITFQPSAAGQVELSAAKIANLATIAGAYVNVNLSGASTATNGLVLGSTQAATLDTFGLIRHVFVGSNDFATENATGNVVATTNYTDQAAVSSWAANQNITDTTSGPASGGFSGTLTAPLTLGSLRFDDNDAGSPALGGNTLTVADGILITTNVSGKALTLNGGQLQPSLPVAPNTTATDLIVVNNGVNGTSLNIGSVIQNNGTSATAFTKAGAGLVTLSGLNTYTGVTYAAGGVIAGADPDTITATTSGTATSGSTTLTVGSTSGLSVGQAVFGPNIPAGTTITVVGGSSVTLSAATTGAVSSGVSFGSVTLGGLGQGNITIAGGVLGLTTNFTRAFGSGPGQLTVSASSGGFAAMTAAGVTVNLGGSSTPLALLWLSGLGGFSGGSWGPNGYAATMTLGASTDLGMVTVANPIDFGNATRDIEVDHGSTPTFDAQFSGVLSAASQVSGFIKTGNGSLWLNNSETYTGATVILAGTVSENGTGLLSDNSPLTIDGSTAVFDLGASHNDTVSTVILDGGGQITGAGSVLTSPLFDFRSGSASASLAGAGTALGKSTAGTVTLSGSNSYTGATNVSGGSLVLASAGALPSGTALTIGSGSSVIANNGLATTLVVSSLSIAGTPNVSTGLLNLGTNNLVVHNGSLSTINSQVAQGFANGNWNSSVGITSAGAAADTTHLTALGVIQNSATGSTSGTPLISSFNTASGLLASDVIVRYTYYGDANLDGKVDASDYSLIDNGYLQDQTTPGSATGWYNGDFNYDGVVNGSDYTLIDNAFNTQGAQFSAEIASPTAEIAGSPATSAVPEPTTLSLLGLGAFGLLGRRRRTR